MYVEPRASANLTSHQLTDLLATVDRIFLNRPGFDGITKSRDSTDKKSLYLVPVSLVSQISVLIKEIEDDVP